MKPYQEYLDPSNTIDKRPIVWKFTVLIDGKKHWFNRRHDVPVSYTGALAYEADPVAEAEAEAAAWDDLERAHMETAHVTWKNDLFAQYSSLLSREQFDRVYDILEVCAPADVRTCTSLMTRSPSTSKNCTAFCFADRTDRKICGIIPYRNVN